MAYAMFTAKLEDTLCLEHISYTAREVRAKVSKLFPPQSHVDAGGWPKAKKAGWRVVRVWVGEERRT